MWRYCEKQQLFYYPWRTYIQYSSTELQIMAFIFQHLFVIRMVWLSKTKDDLVHNHLSTCMLIYFPKISMAMVLPRQFVGKVLQYQLCLSSDIFSQVVLHSGVAVFFSILKIQEQPFFFFLFCGGGAVGR